MRMLVVATNVTPNGVEDEIKTGQHPRIDYMELAGRFGTDYVDYNTLPDNKPAYWLEGKLRLDIRQALQVAGIVRRQRYDAVLSLSERVGIPLSHMLDRRVRHVVIMHHPLSCRKLRLMKTLRTHRRWSAVAAISRAEAECLQQRVDLEPDRVKVLQTAVDVEYFQPGKAPTAPAEQDHLESMGLSHRDYPTLIRAMRLLPGIICYLRAGSSWVSHKAGYENEIIPENVHLKPLVHPIHLRDCYANSRFIVVPICQTTQWSAGCTTVQQAQAMGKAVICTAMPGLSEYVLDGETGILVKPGDHNAMAEAIDYLWNNPERASAMGRRAREWMKTTFSLDQWLDQVTLILKDTQS